MFDLTPEQLAFVSYVAYWVGATVRVLWPYVLKRVQTGESFNWRYVGGQALVTLGAFILILSTGKAGDIGALGIPSALVAGFAFAAIGRNGQKTVDVVRK
jgi:drug/metabolite transporter (DMT)-like permease